MGRTLRKRRRKSRSFETCDESKELILLNSWLAKNGVKRSNKLSLAVFPKTGRGVLTKKRLCSGEELMNLPLNITINVTSVLMDNQFCDIFLQNNKQCLIEYKQKLSFQSLLAFYLTYLKVQGPGSKWHVYLESLPKCYTVSYFLPKEIRHHIDADILDVITKQKNVIETSFNIFRDILTNSRSNSNIICKLKENFTLSNYEWSFFTVNTRCVYMDLTKVIDLINIEKSILNLVNDNTKISLCPYLDMINHSASARNETKLIISKNIENISISNLKQDLFSDVWFSIYTKNNFDAFTQVFICYGDSHNLKLITEYGFFLPANDLDHVTFCYEDVKVFLSTNGSKLSQDQISFINCHGLNKDLYIDLKGLSFNFYGFLMVVKYFYNCSTEVSRLIYSAAICSNDSSLNRLILPLVSEKLVNIKESISKLETYDTSCIILNNCVALMNQYVTILEKFIKC